MAEWKRTSIDPAFSVEIPPEWIAERDEEEGVSVSAEEGAGLLHLVAFPRPPGEQTDPAEELYAFLEEQEIEILEDEVEDIDLTGGAELSCCEYVAEEGEDEASTYWLVGVATGPGALVFVSYSCPAGEEDAEREVIRRILTSLELRQAP